VNYDIDVQWKDGPLAGLVGQPATGIKVRLLEVIESLLMYAEQNGAATVTICAKATKR